VGLGLGWGLSSWGYGSALYGMGYAPYYNPYYYGDTGVVGQPVVAAAPYDYSQPIDTVSAPAEATTADPAMALFDAGRQSFTQGNYGDALQQTNQALATLPNDTTLHEFRALCLFALGRYDEAAAGIYAVLSVGPGWDWTTLIGLYPGIEPYTTQLRTLEDYCRAHPDSAQAYFVLAYHYLTQGHTDTAVNVLRRVVALQPKDALSAKLLRQLDPSQDKPSPGATTPSAPPPADTTPPDGATIAGTWKAQPVAGTTVSLTIQPAGEFTWQVTQNGKTQNFAGTSNFGDGLLTLAQTNGPVMVGRVSWKDANHMTFRVAGDGPEDPGLSFAK
jgi:tetratricopeptide (TPR) repeat protein